MYTLLKSTVNTVHPGIVEALFTLHIYNLESTRTVMNARSDRTHAQLLKSLKSVKSQYLSHTPHQNSMKQCELAVHMCTVHWLDPCSIIVLHHSWDK